MAVDDLIQQIKDAGCDFAIRGWANDKPNPGVTVLIWKAGHAENTVYTVGPMVEEAIAKAIETIKEQEEASQEVKTK